LFDSLVSSIQNLQKNKYSKGNKKKLNAILHALNQAKPLFYSDHQNPDFNSSSIKLINFRNIGPEEQIQKILDEFMDDFENQCLEKNIGSAKNYSLFAVTSYKIIKTLEEGKKRGLLSAHTVNRLNKMFVKYPVKYGTQAIRDPLGLIFVITELAIDIEKNLGKEYEFDEILLLQLTPFIQRYYIQTENPLMEILNQISDMPKFKLTVQINEKHKKFVKNFLDYSIIKLPLEEKIIKAKFLLEKILNEENDLVSLEYYNTLKISFSDTQLRPLLAKIAKSMPKSSKRFANTILEEIAML
jgi:DNA-binding TFAR19-related protein (PDSD5 family)